MYQNSFEMACSTLDTAHLVIQIWVWEFLKPDEILEFQLLVTVRNQASSHTHKEDKSLRSSRTARLIKAQSSLVHHRNS